MPQVSWEGPVAGSSVREESGSRGANSHCLGHGWLGTDGPAGTPCVLPASWALGGSFLSAHKCSLFGSWVLQFQPSSEPNLIRDIGHVPSLLKSLVSPSAKGGLG